MKTQIYFVLFFGWVLMGLKGFFKLNLAFGFFKGFEFFVSDSKSAPSQF